MRGTTHTDRLDVRVHPELKAKVAELAMLRHMTPSEFAREVLRQAVN